MTHRPIAVRRENVLRCLLLLIGLPLCAGCPSLTPLPSEAPVRELIEPTTGRSFLYYVPSTYSDGQTWPVVVACHGTPPYDTADLQMREWARFGEDHGIVIVAPRLVATKGDFPPPAARQIALQKQDEEALLAIVRWIKGRYHVAEEQVLMTGWSAAGYTILHTGLQHPDVFRALAIRQGNFDANFLDVPKDTLDRWQPILVIYGRADLLRDQSMACIEWLRERNMYVDTEEVTGAHRRVDPELAWKYFRRIVRERPWIRILAEPPNAKEPLKVRFAMKTVPPLEECTWFPGDGSRVREQTFVHEYAKSGCYEVTVNARLKGSKTVFQRTRVLKVEEP